MGRRLVLFLMCCAVCVAASGQWGATLMGGVALPTEAGEGMPELRASLATGLRGSYALGSEDGGWELTAEVWHLRQLKEHNPSLTAVPLDTAFHVKRYQLIPFMLGVGYRFPLSSWASGVLRVGAGGYFRYMNFRQQTSAGVIDDLGESGWGASLRAGAEVTLWKRVSVEVWFTAMGSLGGSGEWKEENKAVTFNRTHWHIEGYRQCFWGASIGYCF